MRSHGQSPGPDGRGRVVSLTMNSCRRALRPSLLCLIRPQVLLAICVSLVALDLGAEEPPWGRFRGANGQGIGDGAPLPPDPGPESHVLWRSETPAGASSPVLAGGRVFLTGHDGDDLLVLAYSATDGKELWRRIAPRDRLEKLDPRNDAAAPSIASDGEVVIAFFGDFGLLAYDMEGKELWRKPLGPFTNIYGVGSSPILVADRVLLAVDQNRGSFLLAVDRDTGRTLWNVERPEAYTGHSTPAIYQPAGGDPQIVIPGSFFLTAHALEDGARLWWVRGLSFEMKSVPAIGDGRLFINGYGSELNEEGAGIDVPPFATALEQNDANGDGLIAKDEMPEGIPDWWHEFNDLDTSGQVDATEWKYFQDSMETRNNMMAVRLPAAQERGDLTETHRLWQYFRMVPQLPSPLLYRDLLWMVNDRGLVTTFRPDSGEVITQGRVEGAVDSVYASPVAGDGKIFLLTRSGKLAVLPADGALEPLALTDFGETAVATPAIVDGRMYVRTESALWAFGAGMISARPE